MHNQVMISLYIFLFDLQNRGSIRHVKQLLEVEVAWAVQHMSIQHTTKSSNPVVSAVGMQPSAKRVQLHCTWMSGINNALSRRTIRVQAAATWQIIKVVIKIEPSCILQVFSDGSSCRLDIATSLPPPTSSRNWLPSHSEAIDSDSSLSWKQNKR